MQVHLIDGTYEMYRQHYGSAIRDKEPPPFAATIGILSSTLQLLTEGATHIAVATDHVIESFRNELYDGYKTSEGMEPVLLEQIPIVEDALRAMGVTVWAMEKYEADDALASGVAVACEDRRVHQVRILTPDKDLGQCVSGRRVVQVDRRNNLVLDETAIREKFGIGPESIADYLALVGDTADGFPGLPGWGAKSASTVLARYVSLDAIPETHEQWRIDGLTTLRGAEKLATTLRTQRKDAELFRTLATLVQDVPVGSVDSWKWSGVKPEFAPMLEKFGATHLLDRLDRIKALSQ